MGQIGMPELIMIFIVLAMLAGGALAVAGIVYFVVKKTNKPPAPLQPPPLAGAVGRSAGEFEKAGKELVHELFGSGPPPPPPAVSDKN